MVQVRVRCRAAVAREAEPAGSGKDGEGSVWGALQDLVAPVVDDEQLAARCDRERGRALRGDGRRAGARPSGRGDGTAARDRRGDDERDSDRATPADSVSGRYGCA
jgi:hypothetical protein